MHRSRSIPHKRVVYADGSSPHTFHPKTIDKCISVEDFQNVFFFFYSANGLFYDPTLNPYWRSAQKEVLMKSVQLSLSHLF